MFNWFAFVWENRLCARAEARLVGFNDSLFFFLWEFFIEGLRWVTWEDFNKKGD